MIKKLTFYILLIGLHSNTCGQVRTGMFAEIVLIDTLIKSKNYSEIALEFHLKNQIGESIYLPNTLIQFENQIVDSIKISKLSHDNEILITSYTGSKHLPLPFGMKRYLLNRYWPVYQSKKNYADTMISNYAEVYGRRNFNPLFLRPDEKFILYQKHLYHNVFKEPGDYRIDFIYAVKPDYNLPESIAGYRKIVSKPLKPLPIFLNIKLIKSGYRVLIKNSKGKKIRTFKWKFKRYL